MRGEGEGAGMDCNAHLREAGVPLLELHVQSLCFEWKTKKITIQTAQRFHLIALLSPINYF